MSRVGNFFNKLFKPAPEKIDLDKDKTSMMKALKNVFSGTGRSRHWKQAIHKARGWAAKKRKENKTAKRSRKNNGMRGRKHIMGRK